MGNYKKLLYPIENFWSELFHSPELYLQFILALLFILLAYSLGYISRKYAARYHLKNKTIGSFYITALKFLSPAIAIILLAAGSFLSQEFFNNSKIMLGFTRLAVALLIIMLVWILSESKTIARAITILIIPIVILNLLGLLSPTIGYFDSLAFSIGKFKLSLYSVLKGIVSLTILLWITGLLARTGEKYIRRIPGISFSAQALFIKFFEIALYLIVFLLILNIMGVDLTALAVFGGAIGVGVGFGLQKITSNFISGIILLAEKTIKAGDLVEMDGGLKGTVKYMGARALILESYDGREILIPNEDFITSKVTNWTYTNNNARVEIKVGVAYDSDIEVARQIMLEIAKQNPSVLQEPEPSCFIHNFDDSAITILLFFWADIAKGLLAPRSEILTAIWHRFNAAGIKIPFPQRDVHIIKGEES